MKVSKKVKIITVISIVIAGIFVIACSSLGNSKVEHKGVDITVESTVKWKEKASQLFNHDEYGQLLASSPVINKNISDEMTESQVAITNQFGIRDDILDFILKYFSNNEPAIYAAIRNEQYNILIYSAKNDKEDVFYADEGGIPIWCLGNAIGGVDADKYYDALYKIRQSTPEGIKIDEVVRNKLAWKVFGFKHKSTQELNAICNKGAY